MRSFALALALLSVFAAAQLPGDSSEYFDILGTGHKDWRLAFRGTAAVRQSIWTAFVTSGSTPSWAQDGCKGTNWTAPCTSHYRNDDALDNWSNVREVLYGIVDDGKLVKTIRFKGAGTSAVSWMSKDGMVKSCWEDLTKDTMTNYFSAAGHAAVQRRFFISREYAGCPEDKSWTVVADQVNGPCTWDQSQNWPVIKYVPGQRYENVNQAAVKNAQAMVVFVNYFPGQPDEYHDLFRSGEEYRLAFRGSAGVGSPLYDAYEDGSGILPNMDPGCKSVDFSAPCNTHYRNDDALDNWKNIDEVLVGIIYKGEMVKTIVFRGENTTYKDWMSAKNLKKSCWDDLKTKSHNFFSIYGDGRLNRRFFIQHRYGGCHNDIGWLVSSDNPPRPCSWESGTYPVLKFAAGPKAENWTDGEVLDAEAFVVFLKYTEL